MNVYPLAGPPTVVCRSHGLTACEACKLARPINYLRAAVMSPLVRVPAVSRRPAMNHLPPLPMPMPDPPLPPGGPR